MKKNISKIQNIKKGVTLVETLIYIFIFTSFMIGISSFIKEVLITRSRNQIMNEVNIQGVFASGVFQKAINDAVSINTPATSTTAVTLSLNTGISTTTPTVFSVINNVLYIQEASSTPIALTNNKVSVNNFNVTNLSVPNKINGAIKIRFDIKNILTSNRAEEQYLKTFYVGAVLKK